MTWFRYWQGCRVLLTLSQACHKLVITLSQPCNNFTRSLQCYDHNVMFPTSLSQACHNIVIFCTLWWHCKLVTRLHVFILIIIMTKTQIKCIKFTLLKWVSIHQCSLERHYFRFQNKQCKLGVRKQSVCIGSNEVLSWHEDTLNLTLTTLPKFKIQGCKTVWIFWLLLSLQWTQNR